MASRIVKLFQDLEDPRKSNAAKHDFAEMLTLAVVAVICGHEICVDMENFSKVHRHFLRTFLKLKHDIPSHDAFSRLFRILDPEAFEGTLLKLANIFNHHFSDSAGKIDMNSLVRKFDQPSRKSAIYLLNVFGLSVRITFAESSAAVVAIPAYLQQICAADLDEPLDEP
ncbi:MAG: ISAs1 family transposase [Synechococcus sp. SB0666_bin_14]|nr:ISAs1 family transposase [Synechococcus sp. SB0666_bin_14]MYG47370.1 ISAs1 family transposase [Synechococcus sp. SB0675_bin_6]MYK91886.1 ISAs1 family transposase [Synechococcus sp. SB0669_bin_8]